MLEENPFSSPQGMPQINVATGAKSAVLGFDAVQPIYRAKGWLRLLGILNIIAGVIYCLTIIGIIVGWLPIWIGMLLNKASTHIRVGVEQSSPGHVQEAMRALGTTFTIIGVLTLIGLIINVLYLVVLIVIAIVGIAAGAAANM